MFQIWWLTDLKAVFTWATIVTSVSNTTPRSQALADGVILAFPSATSVILTSATCCLEPTASTCLRVIQLTSGNDYSSRPGYPAHTTESCPLLHWPEPVQAWRRWTAVSYLHRSHSPVRDYTRMKPPRGFVEHASVTPAARLRTHLWERLVEHCFVALQHWRLCISRGLHDYINSGSVSPALSGTYSKRTWGHAPWQRSPSVSLHLNVYSIILHCARRGLDTQFDHGVRSVCIYMQVVVARWLWPAFADREVPGTGLRCRGVALCY